MLHAVALMAIAGALPANGGSVAASASAALVEVRLGGASVVDGAQGRVDFIPQTLPETSLSTGRLENQAPPPVAWVSSGAAAAKALPSSSTMLPVGDRVVAAVGTLDVHAPGGGAHPWRPG